MEKRPEALFPNLPLLLVDDEPAWLQRLAFSLEYSAGINHVLTCSDSREVLKLLDSREVGVILLDLMMPHLCGEDLLPQLVENHPDIPVIVLSGLNQVETAVRCMRAGAFDYFVKTVETERLVAGVRRALAHLELRRDYRKLKNQLLRDSPEKPEAFSDILTASRQMHSIFRYLEAVAGSREPVLITGESGTGKELVARAIYRLTSPDAPWMAVNAAGLDDQVFADTLFGHTRGAFTGADRGRPGMIEQAAGGILFLDEIGDLTSASQVKLLRLLQEGEYYPLGSDAPKRLQARIVLATNHDLEERQAEGSFRKDLYYRICVHHVHLPPLRERPEDIPLLLDLFLKEAAQSLGKKPPTPPRELPVLLSNYSFPGNIRELRAMIYHAVSLHQGGVLSMESFIQAVGGGRKNQGAVPRSADSSETVFSSVDRLPTLEEAGEILVTEALRRSQGNQTMAARLLGISQPALHKRLKKNRRPSPSAG